MTVAHCWLRLRRHTPGERDDRGQNTWTTCRRCGRHYIVGTKWGGPK